MIKLDQIVLTGRNWLQVLCPIIGKMIKSWRKWKTYVQMRHVGVKWNISTYEMLHTHKHEHISAQKSWKKQSWEKVCWNLNLQAIDLNDFEFKIVETSCAYPEMKRMKKMVQCKEEMFWLRERERKKRWSTTAATAANAMADDDNDAMRAKNAATRIDENKSGSCRQCVCVCVCVSGRIPAVTLTTSAKKKENKQFVMAGIDWRQRAVCVCVGTC